VHQPSDRSSDGSQKAPALIKSKSPDQNQMVVIKYLSVFSLHPPLLLAHPLCFFVCLFDFIFFAGLDLG
jgi:hypothetical protein